MQKLHVDTICDICWKDDDQKETEAEHGQTAVLAGKPIRLEWCANHDTKFSSISAVIDAFFAYGMKVEDVEPRNPRIRPSRPRNPELARVAGAKLPKPFVCEQCGKAYATQIYYDSHLNEHAGKASHFCTREECKDRKPFGTGQALGMHMYKKHGVLGKRHGEKNKTAG